MNRVQHLDAIQRCGAKLSDAVDALDLTDLRALADRYDLKFDSDYPALRKMLKRRLVGAAGRVKA